MVNEKTVRLRDQRKPGHGWFDNEIYDVFGDELRQDGISVYMTLTRLCYGVSVTMSLREMAGHARMSKDTFGRNLKRVIAIGLVIERKGATPQSASTYELVDVKELAGKFLREAVEAARAGSGRESVSRRDTRPASSLAELVSHRAEERRGLPVLDGQVNCLTVRQIGKVDAIVEKKIWAEEFATDVSQNSSDFATEVSHQVRHLRQDTRHKTQNTSTPPTPFQGAVGSHEGPWDDEERQRLPSESKGNGEAACAAKAAEAAVAKVMRECGFSNPRLAKVVRAAMELEHSRTDAPVDWNATAERMIRSHAAYVEESHLMRYKIGPRKFLGEGLWLDDRLWPHDEAKVEAARRSRVGTPTRRPADEVAQWKETWERERGEAMAV